MVKLLSLILILLNEPSVLTMTPFLCMDLELMRLQDPYSLSVLLYAISALSLTKKQFAEMNVCWNRARSQIRRIGGSQNV